MKTIKELSLIKGIVSIISYLKTLMMALNQGTIG